MALVGIFILAFTLGTIEGLREKAQEFLEEQD
jgi:hypothetical protein